MLRRVVLCTLLALCSAVSTAPADLQTIQFFGFFEGDVVRDEYMFRGVRVAPDSRGGPFYDDAGSFALNIACARSRRSSRRHTSLPVFVSRQIVNNRSPSLAVT